MLLICLFVFKPLITLSDSYINKSSAVYDLLGSIQTNYKITMHLENKKGSITGYYYYDTYKTQIPLYGQLDKHGNIRLSTDKKNLNKGEVFSGRFITEETITGKWFNPDKTKQYVFEMFKKFTPPFIGYFNQERVYDAGEGIRGHFSVWADIYEKDSMYYIDFGITRDPPGQVIGAAVIPVNNNNTLEFFFTDGWDNKGKGKFYKKEGKYIIELEVVEKSENPWNPVLSLYSNYELKKISEKPRNDRNPWSPGKQ